MESLADKIQQAEAFMCEVRGQRREPGRHAGAVRGCQGLGLDGDR